MQKNPAIAALLSLSLMAWSGESAQTIPVKSGQTILLIGDSITAQGFTPKGWVTLMKSGLAANLIEVNMIDAGASGANSNNVLDMLTRQLKVRRPDAILLNCGLNDAKEGGNSCPIGTYQTNLDAMLDQAGKAKIKVLLWTTVAWENHQPGSAARRLTAERNAALVPYNDYLCKLAKHWNCPLIDINAEYTKALAADRAPAEALTDNDGLHPSPKGHFFLAQAMLRGLGLGKEAMAKAEAAWVDEPVDKPEPAKRKN